MVRKGPGRVRAAFADARAELDRQTAIDDPPAIGGREVGGDKVLAGQWPGHPVDRLPPGCPVQPLGKDGKISYFVDTLGQLIPVTSNEWGKKILIDLFALTPNFLEWAWPKWAKSKDDFVITGIAADDAAQCLVKAAAGRGLFQPIDRVRGRGAWVDDHGRLIWHSGDGLWTVVPDGRGARLQHAPPGEIDGLFYPARPLTIVPWLEPVPAEDNPAREIFTALTSWSWGRPGVDPVIVVGALGAMLIGGALPWRPHLFVAGDMKTGKTELQRLVKAVLGAALHDAANTTEAGVRQRLGLDTLPVAVDEMEASADNRRVEAIIELARLASSGARHWRGGADHKGVEFQARSAFFMTGIIPPPMRPQDRSRFALLDLDQLADVGEPPRIEPDAGRMILRGLMDAWPEFDHMLGDWRVNLKQAGLDGRQQDTWGTLFAIAELMLGAEIMEDAGLPVTDAARVGEAVAAATRTDRAAQQPNWRTCLEHVLGSTIDAWKSGEKPTVGAVLDEIDETDLKFIRNRLAAAGLGLVEERPEGGAHGERRYLLAVPRSSPSLGRLYQGSRWQDGGWWSSLRQGVHDGAVRDGYRVVKINRVAAHCLLVDLARYDEIAGDEG